MRALSTLRYRNTLRQRHHPAAAPIVKDGATVYERRL
jgi:hypothetical protein